MLPTRDPPQNKRPTQTEIEELETNIPNKWTGKKKKKKKKSRGSNTYIRQKNSKRIQLHQTSSTRDAKGTALRKGRKRERERNTGRKNGNE